MKVLGGKQDPGKLLQRSVAKISKALAIFPVKVCDKDFQVLFDLLPEVYVMRMVRFLPFLSDFFNFIPLIWFLIFVSNFKQDNLCGQPSLNCPVH